MEKALKMIGKKREEKYRKIWQKVFSLFGIFFIIYFIEAASDSEKSDDEAVPVLTSEDYERLKVRETLVLDSLKLRSSIIFTFRMK